MCPDEGGKTPVIRLKKVVLPEPFGPMIAFIDPFSTSSDTLLTATSPPKLLVNPLVLRIISFFEDNSTSFSYYFQNWISPVKTIQANNISFGIW